MLLLAKYIPTTATLGDTSAAWTRLIVITSERDRNFVVALITITQRKRRARNALIHSISH